MAALKSSGLSTGCASVVIPALEGRDRIRFRLGGGTQRNVSIRTRALEEIIVVGILGASRPFGRRRLRPNFLRARCAPLISRPSVEL